SAVAHATQPDSALPATLAAAVPKGVKLVVAEQNEQASIPWRVSGLGQGAPYTAQFANFNGGPAVLEALISGAADVGYIGEAPLPIAVAAGVDDLVAIGLLANPGSPGNYYLVAQANSGIEDVAALKNKTVAYPPGTGRHMVLASLLHANGLTLGKDVQGVQLAGAEVAPTFASGAVDAAILLGNQYFRVGEPPIVGDGSGHNWGLNVLLARKQALEDPAKSAAIADFLRRAVAFHNWQIAHSDEWIESTLVARQGLTLAQGQWLVKSSGHGTYYPIDDRSIEVFQSIADGLVETGALKRKVAIAPYIDRRFNAIVEWQNKADGVVPPRLEQQPPPSAHTDSRTASAHTSSIP
ncbi:MAG: ABC transporter substrate-binding protein, partial [Burkholderiaceae bacterium]|nr:ABC transporter substrate-binding protein [Burkholderiaceae bacterium]